MSFSWKKHLSPTTLILTPLKQHFACCVAVPVLLKLAGGIALVQTLVRDPLAELLILGAFMPFAVWAILTLEDRWRSRHARKHQIAHDPCDHHCAPHYHAGEVADFRQRFFVNLTIAYAVAVALHLLFHHH